jgi:Ca2+-binding RTX toxin-like protein
VLFPSSITARPPVFEPDGSIILCGRQEVHPTLNEERTWMRRLNSDGSIDEDFGLVLQRDFQFAAAVVDTRGGLISVGEQHQLSDSLVLTRLAEDNPQAPGTLTVSGGVASMQGTSGDDQIEFRDTDNVIAVTRNTWGKAFDRGTVTQFAADGGDGDDVLIAARGLLIPARFNGEDGRDRLGGGPGRETLIGGAQSDRIAGAGGADLIIGNGGNDVIQGGAGADHIYGGAGNDILLGNGGNDLLNAGAGQNRLLGGAGDDTFFAANGSADTLVGDAGRDTAQVDQMLDELHGVES